MTKRIDIKRIVSCAAALLFFAAVMLAARYLGTKRADSRQPAQQASAPLETGVSLPAIMYHSIYKDPGESRYIVTPSQLESDLEFIKQNGFTTVSCAEIISYRQGNTNLPDKPILLTFDDGCYNFLTNVLPLLEKYDMCCTLSPVGRYTVAAGEGRDKDPAYSYLSAEDLKTVLASGRVELANHSFDMHSLDERRGSRQMATETFEQYRRALFNDVFEAQRLFRDELGIEPKVYTYPYGLSCAAGEMLLEMCGFELLLGCEETPNLIRRGDSLLTLGRFNRDPSLSTAEFMSRAL